MALEELEGLENPFHMTLGGERVRLFHDNAMTACAEDTDGILSSGVLAYREGGLDFFQKFAWPQVSLP